MVQIVCILTLHQDIISPFVFPEAKCPGTIGSLSLPISRDTLIQRQWTGWVVWVPHCLRIHTITHNPTTSWWWWQQSWEFHLLTPLYEVIWNLINILQTMDKHTEADVHGTEEIKWWTLDSGRQTQILQHQRLSSQKILKKDVIFRADRLSRNGSDFLWWTLSI